MTKEQIIEKTLCDMSCAGDCDAQDDELIAFLRERVPDGDSKTCEDFKHLGVECCDTCHRFVPETDMYSVDLPDGGKAWICCAVRSVLFPEPEEDKSDPEVKLLAWVVAGNKLGDYCGYVPPELLEKIVDAGLLNEGDGDAEPEDKE